MAIPSKASLLNLKIPQLKFLLKNLGLEVTGSKEKLVSRITSHKAVPLGAPKRVVSIDMGIRNLAFCFIELPNGSGDRSRPKVLAWERICIPPTAAGKDPPGMEFWNTTKVPAEGEEGGGEGGRKVVKKEVERRTKMSQLMEELKSLVPGLNPQPEAKAAKPPRPVSQATTGPVATSVNWGQTLSERLKTNREPRKEQSRSQQATRGRGPLFKDSSPEEQWLESPAPRPTPSQRRKPKTMEELREILAESLAERAANPPPKPITESFEPAIFAVHANNFCKSLVQRFPPLDAILIEQQRLKSGAGVAVIEWIIHVNRFEAMIHSVLRCLRDQGKINTCAESVSPARVMDFWIDGRTKVMSRVRRRTASGELAFVERKIKGSGYTKMQKMALVSEWVEQGTMFDVAEGVRGIADHFIRPAPGVRKKMIKLDDLADCLLQGLAWAQWQENRRKFAEGTLMDELNISVEK